MGFINLHTHSEYSFFGSLIRIEDLVGFCAFHGYPGVALTDTLSTYGFFELTKLCEKEKLKPVYGIELFIKGDSGKNRYPILLIGLNYTGLHNLLKLNTIAQHTSFIKKQYVISRDTLRKFSQGIAVIIEAEILMHIDDMRYLTTVRDKYREIFGDHVYLEINYTGLKKVPLIKRLIEVNESLGLTPLASCEARYFNEDKDAFLFLNSHRLKSHSGNERGFPIDLDADFVLKKPDEMRQIFRNHPDFIENTEKLFEQIDIRFDIKSFKIPSFSKNANKLREITKSRCSRLGYGKEYEDRLMYELSIIEKLQLQNFFLIVWDIARFMRKSRIPFGWGRGSSVSSLVLFLLGVTKVDPVANNLMFERFLNPGRKQLPDVDIDVCWRRRHEVFEYLTERYGALNVAHLAAIDRMMARSCIREISKVYHLHKQKLEQLLAVIPFSFTSEHLLSKSIHDNPVLNTLYLNDPEIRHFLDIARKIEGVASHTSVHAGGIMILPRGITRYASMEHSRDGHQVAQLTKDDLEDTGFIKIDVLGLRFITIIHDTMRMAKIKKIRPDDHAAYELLWDGDTTGIFQLESGGMKTLLEKIRPETVPRLCDVISLYRPGPTRSGMTDEYIRRHQKTVDYTVDKHIAAITKDTYGLFIYQEQVLAIAHDIAGMSWERADILRKALSSRNSAKIVPLKEEFIAGCVERKIGNDYAEGLFSILIDFGRYGFNKSHAMAYAYAAYTGAFLKAHYTLEFFVSSLNNNLDFISRLNQYLNDVKMHHIEILPIDINESGLFFSADGNRIRAGLLLIKYLGKKAAKGIIEERKSNGKYADLMDFYLRSRAKGINIKAMEYLVKAGAFDSLSPSPRIELLSIIDELFAIGPEKIKSARRDSENSLFKEETATFSMDDLIPKHRADVKPENQKNNLEMEMEATDLFLTHHPLDIYTEEIGQYRIDKIIDARYIEQVSIIAFFYKLRVIKTKREKEHMAFGMFTDQTGSIEAIIFPKVYKDYIHILRNNAVYLAKGRMEEGKIIVEELFLFERLIRDHV
jgi:DNA polymerase-3 subunit alpha